jgi:hypothetical protein
MSVLSGAARTGVSASVVTLADRFGMSNLPHATGCVGVVLSPRSTTSLVAVSPHDCGSIIDVNGVRTVLKEVDIYPDDLDASLDGRGGDHHYNEWVIRDFDVAGVFAVEPFEVMVKGPPIDFSNHPDPELRFQGIVDVGWMEAHRSEADILATFAGLPIWSLRRGALTRLDQMGATDTADTIYPI